MHPLRCAPLQDHPNRIQMDVARVRRIPSGPGSTHNLTNCHASACLLPIRAHGYQLVPTGFSRLVCRGFHRCEQQFDPHKAGHIQAADAVSVAILPMTGMPPDSGRSTQPVRSPFVGPIPVIQPARLLRPIHAPGFVAAYSARMVAMSASSAGLFGYRRRQSCSACAISHPTRRAVST